MDKGLWRRVCNQDVIKKSIEARAETWNVEEVEEVESNTVEHCGGEMRGSFLCTFIMVGILSGWTQLDIVWNKTASLVVERILEAEKTLSFSTKGLEFDSGREVSTMKCSFCAMKDKGLSINVNSPARAHGKRTK